VTGSDAANELAHDADCVLAVGTRLQDFTTGSNTLFTQAKLVGINANAFDALKQGALSVEADARLALECIERCAWRLACIAAVDRTRT
jgi:3D-(3,5/4)-trihydroxycyclohexane-1,2-dione acylhydrolase (decyclizing)